MFKDNPDCTKLQFPLPVLNLRSTICTGNPGSVGVMVTTNSWPPAGTWVSPDLEKDVLVEPTGGVPAQNDIMILSIARCTNTMFLDLRHITELIITQESIFISPQATDYLQKADPLRCLDIALLPDHSQLFSMLHADKRKGLVCDGMWPPQPRGQETIAGGFLTGLTSIVTLTSSNWKT